MNELYEFFYTWRHFGMGWKWYHLFLFALLVSYLFIPLVRRVGLRLKILDYPDARKIHAKPTPRLGGVAIYIAFVGAIFANFHFSLQLKGVLLASTLMFGMGLIEDIRGIPALWRLAGQILAVVILIQYDVVLTLLPPAWYFDGIEWFLTFLWIVGITNAFNFMDGLDGLAGSLGVIACAAFIWVAHFSGQPNLGLLAAAMAGACLGFLRYNIYHASIFMGDSGSTFIGFFLASLGIMGEWSAGNLVVSLACPVLILSIFIYDMIYITIARIASGKTRTFRQWVEYVGKDHLHHRLLDLGFSPLQTLSLICFMSLLFSISAVKMRTADVKGIILELAQAAAGLLLISILVIVGRKRFSKNN